MTAPEKQSVKSLKSKAWKLFSKYIRLKYSKHGICECYTCGSKGDWRSFDCGHCIGGRGNFILFHESCRPQCKYCNLKPPFGKGGNYEIFIPKIIREYGIKEYEELVFKSRQVHKRTKGDYLSLILDLQDKLEEIDDE